MPEISCNGESDIRTIAHSQIVHTGQILVSRLHGMDEKPMCL
ncbi:MAG: hypothetical protein JW830_09155 [Bacteroidales bacterium]|nr:hypothetical protein [Bacteroidales bacterium]